MAYVKRRSAKRGRRARKPYRVGKRRRVGKFGKRSKGMSIARTVQALTSKQLVQDQTFKFNYIDTQAYNATVSNAVIGQLNWYFSATPSAASSTISQIVNLQCPDPIICSMALGNDATRPATGATSSTQRMVIKSYKVRCTITNVDMAPVELQHWRLRAKHDIPETMLSLLNTGYGDAHPGAGPPLNSVANYASPMLSTTYGATPWDNPWIKANFKIGKPKFMRLRPSGVKHLAFHLKKPRVWNNEFYNPGNSADTMIGQSTEIAVRRGESISVFIARGTFATLTSANATFTRGLSNVSLGLVYEHTIKFSTMYPNYQETFAINNMPGFALTAGAAVPAPVTINQPASVILGSVRSYSVESQQGVPDGQQIFTG